ncbi:MAG: chromosomal replication initiator protein DnaA [Desulforegulaceae bacterium]|nr:chromosomal replication initiator protein DnaA [Desulforegulaceae bacterium]
MDNFCSRIKEKLKEKMPAHSFNMWIDPLSINLENGNKVIVECKNSFFKKRILENYSEIIKKVLAEDTEKTDLVVDFTESSTLNLKKKPKKKQLSKNIVKPTQREKHLFSDNKQMSFFGDRFKFQNGRFLRAGYTLDNFIVGKNSEFAYSAALSLASPKRRTPYNSVYIQSDTGLGKSHLSQAVGHHILTDFPQEAVYYVTAEDFTNEMVMSLKSDNINSFKERYRKKCDVLLMDDVQFLSGKARTQQELSMILDYLMEADKKIIFSGSLSPLEIPKLDNQLKSRLSSSLLSIIDKPDFATRKKIARKKAAASGFNISDNIIEYLASELTDSIRQLESGVNSVGIRSSLLGVPLTLGLAEEIMAEITETKREITIDSIKKLVCDEFGVTVDNLVSKSRKQAIVRPRQIAIFLSRKYTDQPLQFIGKSFNRYHATAIHSIKTVEQGIKSRNAFFKQVEVLEKKLESKFS